MKRMLYSLFLITLLCGVPNIWAQSDKDQNAAPDNTKVNTRDRDKNEMTADQQKENRSDRELARQVRRALVKDKSLSTYAHNVKVIARDGAVTLKGPVRSEEEKQAVEAKAVEVAGQGKVTDEISVAPKTDKK
jgi:hyperosmotically inducible periplasmic protein